MFTYSPMNALRSDNQIINSENYNFNETENHNLCPIIVAFVIVPSPAKPLLHLHNGTRERFTDENNKLKIHSIFPDKSLLEPKNRKI